MKKLITLSVFILGVFCAVQSVDAQMPSSPKNNRDQNIIIHKKGSSTEKLTIVIDGDNITVNGKPVDSFKNDQVEIFQNKEGFNRNFPGGPKTFAYGNNFPMALNSNKAMLGVITEKTAEGARITEVSKESAAEKAGLKKDDIITRVGNETISNSEDLFKVIGTYNAGDKVSITYKRDGKINTTSATLEKNSDLRSFNLDNNFNFKLNPFEDKEFPFSFNRKPAIGLQIQDMENGEGAKILNVQKDSPADKAGLKTGDIVKEVNGKKISSVDELKENLREIKEGTSVKLQYSRDNKLQYATIAIPKKLKTADL